MAHIEGLKLPQRTNTEYMADNFFHADELAAKDIVTRLRQNPTTSWIGEAQVPLPASGIYPDSYVPSHAHVLMHIPCNTLTLFMTDAVERLDQKDYLYTQFGFSMSYEKQSSLLRVYRDQRDIPFYIGQTDLLYTQRPYMRAAWSATSLAPEALIDDIREHGVFVTAHASYSEAALAIPGRILNAHEYPALKWQHGWMNDALYPIDLDRKPHEDFIKQGYRDEKLLKHILTDAISPVHIHVLPTEMATMYVRKE
jgi:hypothetical protein